MKLTILVDNYVPNQNDLLGEPSFSCHIEDAGLKILFDTGLSGTPLRNAKRLKIDLSGPRASVRGDQDQGAVLAL